MNFTGSYNFLKKTLIKFDLYKKNPNIIAKYYGYQDHSLVRNSRRGINQRFWQLLHLDLTILNIVNPKMKYSSLEKLKKDFDVK